VRRVFLYRKYVIADSRFLWIMYFNVRCIIYYYYYYDLLLFYIEFQKFPSVRLDLYDKRALLFVGKHTTASADKGCGLRYGSVDQAHLDRNKGRCSVKTHKICVQRARKKKIINPKEKNVNP